MVHSLIGLGFGLILVNYVSVVRDHLLVIGVVAVVLGAAAHVMRK